MLYKTINGKQGIKNAQRHGKPQVDCKNTMKTQNMMSTLAWRTRKNIQKRENKTKDCTRHGEPGINNAEWERRPGIRCAQELVTAAFMTQAYLFSVLA